MITVTDRAGRKHYLAPSAIASVAEAAASSRWHGIAAIVRCTDGRVLEVRDEAASVAEAVSRQGVAA